jgi:Transposase, Mutator family
MPPAGRPGECPTRRRWDGTAASPQRPAGGGEHLGMGGTGQKLISVRMRDKRAALTLIGHPASSTNMLERFNEEIRRRTRWLGFFSSLHACWATASGFQARDLA